MELLNPLYLALVKEAMKSDYDQADETTTPVMDKEKHKAAKEYLWMVRAVMEKLVIFHYSEGSRAGAVIESLASKYNFKYCCPLNFCCSRACVSMCIQG